jgi:hypothetical protein
MQLTNAGARPAIMAVKISVRRAVASRWLKLKSCGRLHLPEVGGTMTLKFHLLCTMCFCTTAFINKKTPISCFMRTVQATSNVWTVKLLYKHKALVLAQEQNRCLQFCRDERSLASVGSKAMHQVALSSLLHPSPLSNHGPISLPFNQQVWSRHYKPK